MAASTEKKKSRNIVIIGSGIIGLTTAYELNKEYNVHVIEKQKDICLGASFQNGGFVPVESIYPFNSYMSLTTTVRKSVLAKLTGNPTNTMIRPAVLMTPNLFHWVKHYLLNSRPNKIRYRSEGMRQMGAAITPLMQELFKNLSLDPATHNFHFTPALRLRTVENPSQYIQQKKEMFDQIYPKQFVTGKELDTLQNESGILGLENTNFNVGVLEPHCLTVNTYRLGESLKSYLVENGVKFSFSKEATLVPDNSGSKIKHVQLDDKEIVTADDYVVCAGYGTSPILKSIGLKIPIMPVKAYSLHISNQKAVPNVKFICQIDTEVAGLFTPYRENGLRVTGIRDLDGANPIERPERVKNLVEVARKFAGSDWAISNTNIWCGLMPLSPDDFPIIGRTQKFSNLYVNAGHGFRGTAHSLPSARLLLQIMRGDKESCFERKYADPARFKI